MPRCIICRRDAGPFSEVCDSCKEKRAPGSSGKPLVRRRISSIVLLLRALVEIKRYWSVLLLAALLPVFISQAIRFACMNVCTPEYGIATYYAFNLARLPFYVLFATICHRVVLEGSEALPNRWGLFWSFRETRFVGWVIAFGIISLIVSAPILAGMYFLPDPLIDWMSDKWFVLSYLCVLLSMYIDGRFGLVLPATAIGEPMSLLKSWRYTAGSSLTIFGALLIPYALTEIFDYVVFGVLITSDAMALNVLRGFIYYPLLAVGVVIITIAYRDLVQADREA